MILEINKIQLKNSSNLVEFELTLENQILIFKETATIYHGTKFAKIHMEVTSKNQNVSFNWLHFPFKSEGMPIQSNNSIGFVDISIGALNQIVLPNETLGSSIVFENIPTSFELVYNVDGKNSTQFEFFVGSSLVQLSNTIDYEKIYDLIAENNENYWDIVTNSEIRFFDYQTAVKSWKISYVISNNDKITKKLVNNVCFNLQYKNGDLAIFKVS